MRAYILLSFALAGCAVDLPSGEYSCSTDADCLNGYSCVQTVCRQGSDVRCVDEDDDGFGVEGALTDCPKCQNEGICDADCDDSDPAINPGARDVCDGVDNNCSGAPDEVLSCDDALSCPSEGSLIPACEGGECVYRPPLQQSDECKIQLVCSNGRRDVPDGCE